MTETVIQQAVLGYHAIEAYGIAKAWGKTVKLPQGIVIPWLIEGAAWRLTIRDERVPEGTGRYRQVAGGANGLYLADALSLKRPVTVVVEGEFDALSLAQECGEIISVVATGTTQGGHTPRWLSLLAAQQRVLSEEHRAMTTTETPPLHNAHEQNASCKAVHAPCPPAAAAPVPYRRFMEAMGRLALPPRIPLRVITPKGKGNLWQVLGDARIGAVLDSDPGRVTFFRQPAEIQAIQPLPVHAARFWLFPGADQGTYKWVATVLAKRWPAILSRCGFHIVCDQLNTHQGAQIAQTRVDHLHGRISAHVY